MSAPYATHLAQIEAILTAWGMPAAGAARTAEILGWADLHGVDSHGLSMLTQYDGWRQEGRLILAAAPKVARESPVSALVDGGGGLGHVPADFAMRLAVEKAGKLGMAAVSVRDSSHFGACGYYALLAAEAGLIGIVTTTASGVRVAPTFGAQAKLGTDPWCFAAPGEAGRPFLLDMATTTVAFGKVRNKANEGLAAPPGWVLTPEGAPSSDPADVTERAGFLTSLGGTADNASYKGYGLAMMVDILAGGLAGMSFPSDPDHTRRMPGIGLGHFFLAMDPGMFRDPAEFQADVARFCGQMRATTPADPGQPVLVAGDRERAIAARRRAEGVPVGAGLAARIRAMAEAAGAPWLLG